MFTAMFLWAYWWTERNGRDGDGFGIAAFLIAIGEMSVLGTLLLSGPAQ